jgi:hypothetical protein
MRVDGLMHPAERRNMTTKNINGNNNVKQREGGKRLGGVTGKGFMPGQSGNPKGRPRTKGLLNALKAAFGKMDDDGRTVEELLIDALKGRWTPAGPLVGCEKQKAFSDADIRTEPPFQAPKTTGITKTTDSFPADFQATNPTEAAVLVLSTLGLSGIDNLRAFRDRIEMQVKAGCLLKEAHDACIRDYQRAESSDAEAGVAETLPEWNPQVAE